jgi:hypothetical protein
MSSMLPGLLALLLLSLAAPSWSGDVQDTTLTRLAIVKTYGDIVFVKVDNPKGSLPACHVNLSWTYVMPLVSEQDKKMYAMLLAARTSQAPVSLNGTGGCDHFASIETLLDVHF